MQTLGQHIYQALSLSLTASAKEATTQLQEIALINGTAVILMRIADCKQFNLGVRLAALVQLRLTIRKRWPIYYDSVGSEIFAIQLGEEEKQTIRESLFHAMLRVKEEDKLIKKYKEIVGMVVVRSAENWMPTQQVLAMLSLGPHDFIVTLEYLIGIADGFDRCIQQNILQPFHQFVEAVLPPLFTYVMSNQPVLDEVHLTFKFLVKSIRASLGCFLPQSIKMVWGQWIKMGKQFCEHTQDLFEGNAQIINEFELKKEEEKEGKTQRFHYFAAKKWMLKFMKDFSSSCLIRSYKVDRPSNITARLISLYFDDLLELGMNLFGKAMPTKLRLAHLKFMRSLILTSPVKVHFQSLQILQRLLPWFQMHSEERRLIKQQPLYWLENQQEKFEYNEDNLMEEWNPTILRKTAQRMWVELFSEKNMSPEVNFQKSYELMMTSTGIKCSLNEDCFMKEQTDSHFLSGLEFLHNLMLAQSSSSATIQSCLRLIALPREVQDFPRKDTLVILGSIMVCIKDKWIDSEDELLRASSAHFLGRYGLYHQNTELSQYFCFKLIGMACSDPSELVQARAIVATSKYFQRYHELIEVQAVQQVILRLMELINNHECLLLTNALYSILTCFSDRLSKILPHLLPIIVENFKKNFTKEIEQIEKGAAVNYFERNWEICTASLKIISEVRYQGEAEQIASKSINEAVDIVLFQDNDNVMYFDDVLNRLSQFLWRRKAIHQDTWFIFKALMIRFMGARRMDVECAAYACLPPIRKQIIKKCQKSIQQLMNWEVTESMGTIYNVMHMFLKTLQQSDLQASVRDIKLLMPLSFLEMTPVEALIMYSLFLFKSKRHADSFYDQLRRIVLLLLTHLVEEKRDQLSSETIGKVMIVAKAVIAWNSNYEASSCQRQLISLFSVLTYFFPPAIINLINSSSIFKDVFGEEGDSWMILTNSDKEYKRVLLCVAKLLQNVNRLKDLEKRFPFILDIGMDVAREILSGQVEDLLEGFQVGEQENGGEENGEEENGRHGNGDYQHGGYQHGDYQHGRNTNYNHNDDYQQSGSDKETGYRLEVEQEQEELEMDGAFPFGEEDYDQQNLQFSNLDKIMPDIDQIKIFLDALKSINTTYPYLFNLLNKGPNLGAKLIKEIQELHADSMLQYDEGEDDEHQS